MLNACPSTVSMQRCIVPQEILPVSKISRPLSPHPFLPEGREAQASFSSALSSTTERVMPVLMGSAMERRAGLLLTF
jgi:hypothetical protein